VLVAGASRGIGAATAIAFARAGARSVALVARDGAALERVAATVREQGSEARPIVADLLRSDDRAAAVEAAGDPDVLVVSAGTNRPQPFLEVDEATYDRLFELNVRSGYFLAQAVARSMQRRGGGGCIVFVSSQMGHVGAPRRSVYCATKHAVEGMAKALAVELAPTGIRVLTVAPTFVRTELTAAELDDPETGPDLLTQIPLGRYATPADVADAILWASRAPMATGTSIVVDGGWTAR